MLRHATQPVRCISSQGKMSAADSRIIVTPCCVLKLLVERDENRDLFNHVVSFLHLEKIAGLLASSKFLRVCLAEISVWRNAEV